MNKLFTNQNEYTDFLNAIAHRRIKKLSNGEKQFEEEINDALEKCGKIFEEFGSQINFISEIIDIEMKMQKDESANDLEDLSLKRESLYNKFNQFLENIPLEQREDLEFYFKKILDRRLRANNTNDIISQIKKEYPQAEDLTVIEIMEQPTFQRINGLLSNDLVKENEAVEETQNLPYVVQIKEAPQDLLETKKEEVIEEKPQAEISEIKPEENAEVPLIPDLEISDLFNSDLEPENYEDKVTPSLNKVEEAPEANVDDIFNVFDSFDEEKPQSIEESKPEDIDINTYTMEKGDTLAGLASALIDDENGWYDIFEANKDLLIKRLGEAGLTKDDPFQYNEEVFAGLTLNIPNVYEKSQAKTLAA